MKLVYCTAGGSRSASNTDRITTTYVRTFSVGPTSNIHISVSGSPSPNILVSGSFLTPTLNAFVVCILNEVLRPVEEYS
jgi:hypothetical protein